MLPGLGKQLISIVLKCFLYAMMMVCGDPQKRVLAKGEQTFLPFLSSTLAPSLPLGTGSPEHSSQKLTFA